MSNCQKQTQSIHFGVPRTKVKEVLRQETGENKFLTAPHPVVGMIKAQVVTTMDQYFPVCFLSEIH